MKIKAIMMAMLAIVFGMSLTACSDDDEKSKSEQVDHVKLVAKINLSQDLADFIHVNLNGTVLEGTGYTKTYTLDVKAPGEQTLEIPLLQAPGKIQETITPTEKLDAPTEITKEKYELSYKLSYNLVEVMKDGKEYVIDTNLYDGVTEQFYVGVLNPANLQEVKTAISTVTENMTKNRNKRFFVAIEKTNTGMDKVKITPAN